MIDLHLHLDGSLLPENIIELALAQNIPLPADTPEGLMPYLRCPSECTSLNDYLACFALPLSVLQTCDAVSAAVYMLCERLKSEEMLYAEIRFAPCLHTENGATQYDIMRSAVEGLKKSGFHANLILCCMRGTDEATNRETIAVAKQFLGRGVAALDLAGAEGLYSTEKYCELFRLAADEGIPFVIHAGEADGAESIRTALNMGASRIGHGVRAAEDSELLTLLQKKQTPIEVCLTSNLQTHAVADIKSHPVKKFLDMGLCVTINTDNMTVSDTTVQKEFALLSKYYGFGENERKILLTNAVHASFLSDAEKDRLTVAIFH